MKIKQLKEFINQLPDEVVDNYHLRFRNIDNWVGKSWNGFEVLLESLSVDEERNAVVLMDLVSTKSWAEKMDEAADELSERGKETEEDTNETDKSS